MKEIIKYQSLDEKVFNSAEECYSHELKIIDEINGFSSKITFFDDYSKKIIPFTALAEKFEDINAIIIKENFDFEILYKELEKISNEDYDFLDVQTIIDYFRNIPWKINKGVWVQEDFKPWTNLEDILQTTQAKIDYLTNFEEN